MSSASMFCPRCAASSTVDATREPQAASCPSCGGRLTIPEADPPALSSGATTTVAPAPDPVPPRSVATGSGARKRPAWQVLGVACLTVAAVAAAVVSIKGFLDQELEGRARPPGLPQMVGLNPAPGDGQTMRPIQAMVGRFQIFRDRAVRGRPVVVSLPAQWTDAPNGIIHGPHLGTLAREAVNQAFLLAARDALGLTTREMILGDVPPSGAPDLFIEIITPYETGQPLLLTVRRGGERGAVLSSRELPFWTDDARDYPRLVEKAEALARGPFAEELRRAGLDAHPNAIRAEGQVDGATEGLLATMTFTTQFAALRRLHAALRADGESPDRLEALVRGYAHLGIETEFHWTPSNKLFKARALLYAERLVARERRSPRALWHRGYARALAGLHRDALEDLAAAEKLLTAAGAKAARPEPPAWVDLIDAYCRFDTNRLAAVRQGRQAGLAQLLRFLTAEDYYDSHRRTLDTAREVLRFNPECFRLHDALCQVGGVANLHQATTLGPQVLTAAVPQRLLQMDDLPEGLAALIRRKPGDVELTEALDAAGAAAKDPSELSWSVLGRLVEEIRFVHVWRRVQFMHDTWNVPVDEFLDQAHALIRDHPFRGFVASYGLSPKGALQALDATSRRLNPADLELTEMPFFQAFQGHDQNAFARMAIQAQRHGDEVYRDLEIVTRTFNDRGISRQPYPFRLQAVSPYAPFAAAKQIKSHWEAVQQHAAEWERAYAQHPQVLGRLALRYKELGRVDDEIRCLEKFNRLCPLRWSFERRAEIYKAEGRLDRWKETLDAFLAQPDDFALDHAQVRVQVARHFMALGAYEEALPYAEAAAQTWAGWAMECASACYEGMGDYEQAELWIRRVTERYPVSWMQWFLFCKRTGSGDVRSARRLAATYLKVAGDRLTDNEEALAVIFYDLAQEPDQGIRFLRERFPRPQHILEGMFLAQFADAVGDATLRDETWKRVADGDPKVVALARMFHEALARGGRGGLDLKTLDALIGSADGMRQADLCYFAGRFLERHGDLEDALAYWRRCAAAPQGKPLIRVLAVTALRDHGAEGPQAPLAPVEA